MQQILNQTQLFISSDLYQIVEFLFFTIFEFWLKLIYYKINESRPSSWNSSIKYTFFFPPASSDREIWPCTYLSNYRWVFPHSNLSSYYMPLCCKHWSYISINWNRSVTSGSCRGFYVNISGNLGHDSRFLISESNYDKDLASKCYGIDNSELLIFIIIFCIVTTNGIERQWRYSFSRIHVCSLVYYNSGRSS